MRFSKNIVLVFPRFHYPSGDIPTGLATLAAYLRQTFPELQVVLLDPSFGESLVSIKRTLHRLKPDITGIYMDILMAREGIKVAALAKEQGARVIAGGPQATLVPDQFLKYDCLDAVCLGEGELTLAAYVRAFYENQPLADIPGLQFKQNGKIQKTGSRGLIADLDILPSPAFDLLDLEQYIAHFFQLDSHDPRLRGVSLTISRGCPYHCTFCQPTVHQVLGRQVRIRSPEKVIADLAYLKHKYRLNAFYLADDLITVVPGWLEQFCRLLKDRRLDLTWACNTRADTLNYETMKQLKAAGLVKIKVGLEAISDRIRNGLYRKQITRTDINRLLEQANRLGVQVNGFFMLGGPTETPTEVWDTVRFAARADLAEALFSVTTPFPGTLLYEGVRRQGWPLPPPGSVSSYYQVHRPRMSRTEISPSRLAVYKKLANFYFYLHPKRLKTTLGYFKTWAGVYKFFLKLRRI